MGMHRMPSFEKSSVWGAVETPWFLDFRFEQGIPPNQRETETYPVTVDSLMWLAHTNQSKVVQAAWSFAK